MRTVSKVRGLRVREAKDRESLMGEALRRAVRGRQRDPGALLLPRSLPCGPGIGATNAALLM